MPVTVVTLLVAPEEAERLTLASSEGKIQLALRNPLDREAPATRGVKPAALLGAAPVARPTYRPRPSMQVAEAASSSAGAANRRNHPWGQTRARSRATGAVIMRRASKALILLIAIVGSSVVYAADGDSVNLTVGRSTVVDTGTTIARVSLTSADVADALVTSSNELLINGKTPGTISMFVWDRAGAIRKYEINVQRDLARLTSQYKSCSPAKRSPRTAAASRSCCRVKSPSQGVVDKAMNVAAGYVEKKDEVVSLLQILPSGASNQVLLRCVSRK